MSLAENLHFHKSASIAFDRSNAIWAKPKPLYVNPQSSLHSLRGTTPTQAENSKSKRKQILLFLLLFFLLSICGLRPLDMLSLRSSSVYCRYAPIRYEINPSFAKQAYRVRKHISNAVGVYRKSCEGFISMRVLR